MRLVCWGMPSLTHGTVPFVGGHELQANRPRLWPRTETQTRPSIAKWWLGMWAIERATAHPKRATFGLTPSHVRLPAIWQETACHRGEEQCGYQQWCGFRRCLHSNSSRHRSCPSGIHRYCSTDIACRGTAPTKASARRSHVCSRWFPCTGCAAAYHHTARLRQ